MLLQALGSLERSILGKINANNFIFELSTNIAIARIFLKDMKSPLMKDSSLLFLDKTKGLRAPGLLNQIF